MTSKLVLDRLTTEGLTPVLSVRERGELPDASLQERIASADTLLLGAAADIVRRRELGDEAIIFVPLPPRETKLVHLVRPLAGEGGTALLRRVATLRLCGAHGLSIVIDWTELGLETAQLGLSFGASGLAGPVAARRGLPLAEVDAQRSLTKRRDIAAYVQRAGYVPRFVNTLAGGAIDGERSAPASVEQGNAHVGS
jgi:2-iminoacetate synthase ThiH